MGGAEWKQSHIGGGGADQESPAQDGGGEDQDTDGSESQLPATVGDDLGKDAPGEDAARSSDGQDKAQHEAAPPVEPLGDEHCRRHLRGDSEGKPGGKGERVQRGEWGFRGTGQPLGLRDTS